MTLVKGVRIYFKKLPKNVTFEMKPFVISTSLPAIINSV